MALLVTEPLQSKYVAGRASFSYLFCWVLAIAAILLPFFLAFTTNNFWIK
jgi:hypothetical protein